jgi:hypothetical protein
VFAQEVVGMVRWGAIVAVCLLSVLGPAVLKPQQDVAAAAAVVVRPGETLWDHAERMTPPGGDVRATVDELARVNGIGRGGTLLAGARLVAPASASLTARLSEGDVPITR